MTIDDIKKLIASDESQTLELKKTTSELKKGNHSKCPFLNTERSWLIFRCSTEVAKDNRARSDSTHFIKYTL